MVPSPTIPTAPRRSAAPFVLALVALLAALAGLGYLLAKQLSGDGGSADLVEVGNYVGQTESEAKIRIEERGLKADIVPEENDQVPAGQVFGQDPAAGIKIEEGKPVTLRVSQGKGQIKIPDVTGETLDDAQQRLADAGLQYRVLQETSDSVDAGKVTRTDPPSGSQAEKGSVVKLYASAGKEQVEIPDVSGQDPVEASNTLGAKSLTVERDQADERHGRRGHGHRHQPAGRHEGHQGFEDPADRVVGQGAGPDPERGRAEQERRHHRAAERRVPGRRSGRSRHSTRPTPGGSSPRAPRPTPRRPRVRW